MTKPINELQKFFQINPAAKLKNPNTINLIRRKAFQRKYVEPPTSSFIQNGEIIVPQLDSFYRLHGTGDAAHRATMKNGQLSERARKTKLARHGNAYFDIREAIAKENYPLTLYMFRKKNHPWRDEDEAKSEANFALTKAIDGFDPWRGFLFSTYCCNSIARQISRLRKKVERQHKGILTFDPERETPHPEPTSDIKEVLIEAMQSPQARELLDERESYIIQERFYSDARGGKGRTYQEIGEAIGKTKERVRQLQNRALLKLRKHLEEMFEEKFGESIAQMPD